jgi:hypothetical protein
MRAALFSALMAFVIALCLAIYAWSLNAFENPGNPASVQGKVNGTLSLAIGFLALGGMCVGGAVGMKRPNNR